MLKPHLAGGASVAHALVSSFSLLVWDTEPICCRRSSTNVLDTGAADPTHESKNSIAVSAAEELKRKLVSNEAALPAVCNVLAYAPQVVVARVPEIQFAVHHTFNFLFYSSWHGHQASNLVQDYFDLRKQKKKKNAPSTTHLEAAPRKPVKLRLPGPLQRQRGKRHGWVQHAPNNVRDRDTTGLACSEFEKNCCSQKGDCVAFADPCVPL